MKKGFLSQYFSGVAAKRISAVEAHKHRSNQHEFDGVASLKGILGPAIPRQQFKARFVHLNDEDSGPVVADGFLTWYDARENHPTRSESRLYFPTTPVSENASEGDFLVIAKRPDNTLLVLIAESGSTAERQIQWLFGIPGEDRPDFSVKSEGEGDRVKLEFASRLILEQIGVEVEETDNNYLDAILEKFGGNFPTTREFSAYARATLPAVSVKDDPDMVVMAWMEREELLFRTLEKHLIGHRLKAGFGDDVDAFISFSLSVQNRRKSRAGSALENHLEYLFLGRRVKYSRTPRTEGKSRPDFVFPGEKEYREAAFPAAQLTMLGVKSSCKERWRQILPEADRIPFKYLFTLEPGISESQTNEMQSKQVQLVLPLAIHHTYNRAQQEWLMNASDFLGYVLQKQPK